MTKQEQIEEMAKIVDEMYNVYTTTADDIAEGLYNAGYRKVDDLKAENKQLKTECALLDDELRIARQDTINVLNELRERIKTAIDTYFNKNGGGYYLAEDAIDDIDELINEVLNADKD